LEGKESVYSINMLSGVIKSVFKNLSEIDRLQLIA